MRKRQKSSPAVTKQDIRKLSVKIDDVSRKIDRNQKALNQIDKLSTKIDRNQKTLDQLDDVGRIIRENEENLKNLSGLQHRLDTLDKIFVTVDKMAGDAQSYQQEQELNSGRLSNHEDRLETIEKHLKISVPA